jgi:hypothetical protein
VAGRCDISSASRRPNPPRPDAIPINPLQRLAYRGEYENPGEAVLTLEEAVLTLEEHEGDLVLSTTATDPAYLTVRPAPPLPPPMRLAFAAPDRAFFAEQPSEQIPFLLGVGGEVLGFFVSARLYRKRSAGSAGRAIPVTGQPAEKRGSASFHWSPSPLSSSGSGY